MEGEAAAHQRRIQLLEEDHENWRSASTSPLRSWRRLPRLLTTAREDARCWRAAPRLMMRGSTDWKMSSCPRKRDTSPFPTSWIPHSPSWLDIKPFTKPTTTALIQKCPPLTQMLQSTIIVHLTNSVYCNLFQQHLKLIFSFI